MFLVSKSSNLPGKTPGSPSPAEMRPRQRTGRSWSRGTNGPGPQSSTEPMAGPPAFALTDICWLTPSKHLLFQPVNRWSERKPLISGEMSTLLTDLPSRPPNIEMHRIIPKKSCFLVTITNEVEVPEKKTIQKYNSKYCSNLSQKPRGIALPLPKTTNDFVARRPSIEVTELTMAPVVTETAEPGPSQKAGSR